MSKIRNTRREMQDTPGRLGFLLEAMADGPSAPIERMERDGQAQLVNSDRLPSDFKGKRAEWEALGFTFGDPDPDDPMFMPATLPEGWQREGSDHAMWSYLVDEHGRQRVGIFYKAAFYDRSASMHLEGLDWYVAKHVEYDGPLVLTGEWATRESVSASLRRLGDREAEEAGKWRGYAADVKGRDKQNRADCAAQAEKCDAKAAKYAAKLAEL